MGMTTPESPSSSHDNGPQPLVELMAEHSLKPNHLVEASMKQVELTSGLTHKMISRAMKGRKLTPKVRLRIVDALNLAAGTNYGPRELFNYLKQR